MVHCLPAATVSRLPLYHQILKSLLDRGRDFVSSDTLAKLMSIDPSLVRKDLASLGSGTQRLGYHVATTMASIETILGMRNTKEAFLVGVGSLGRALLAYRGFCDYGLKIVAAFDTDNSKVGQTIGDAKVMAAEKLPGLARRLGIRMGIITVPAGVAQHVAEVMVESGITAIWNFAPVMLEVPEFVLIRNENLAAGLARLSYDYEQRLNNTKEGEGEQP